MKKVVLMMAVAAFMIAGTVNAQDKTTKEVKTETKTEKHHNKGEKKEGKVETKEVKKETKK